MQYGQITIEIMTYPCLTRGLRFSKGCTPSSPWKNRKKSECLALQKYCVLHCCMPDTQSKAFSVVHFQDSFFPRKCHNCKSSAINNAERFWDPWNVCVPWLHDSYHMTCYSLHTLFNSSVKIVRAQWHHFHSHHMRTFTLINKLINLGTIHWWTYSSHDDTFRIPLMR